MDDTLRDSFLPTSVSAWYKENSESTKSVLCNPEHKF